MRLYYPASAMSALSLLAISKGVSGPFPANFELSTLTKGAGKTGFVINGVATNDFSGNSVSSAGDINGDGFNDIIIGAFRADPNGNSSGASYVVFGKKEPFNATLELSSLNGTNGFKLNGVNANDSSGNSVSTAGDVNGDGLDDLIIGADSSDPNGDNSGESYVVFGKKEPFIASLELYNLNGTNGFKLNGIDPDDFSGRSVSKAGDVNGDGFDDVIIGALRADPHGDFSGESYVIFGKREFFSASLELNNLNGTNGFKLNGINLLDESGCSVSNAGDINGDGLDDLIIGAYHHNIFTGESYVVFGNKEPFNASFELSSLNGSNGFKLSAINQGDFFGRSVSDAGDINGDGLDDLIIGADIASPNGDKSGQSYIVFGKAKLGNAEPFKANFESSSLNGTNGFKLNGINSGDRSGISVSKAGDINGDGLDDLIIGASNADPNGTNSGQSYVVFGKRESFSASFELSSLNGSNGFKLNGINSDDFSGSQVSNAGDINGDGTDDLMIGASSANPSGKTSAGESYVVYGRDYSPQGDFTANFAPDLLIRKGKTLQILPLIISDGNQAVRTELPETTNLSFPLSITPKNNQLSKKTRLLAALDFDEGGVSDLLVKESKTRLKLFRLENSSSLPINPTLLDIVDFTLPKKHRYIGAAALVGPKDDRLDLVLQNGKKLFVVENLKTSFSSELKPLTGKIEGKILSFQKDRVITTKGGKINQQPIMEFTLGAKTELGILAKGQKPVAILDVNQDGVLDIITFDKKGNVGFVSEGNLSAAPTVITTLSKNIKVFGAK